MRQSEDMLRLVMNPYYFLKAKFLLFYAPFEPHLRPNPLRAMG